MSTHLPGITDVIDPDERPPQSAVIAYRRQHASYVERLNMVRRLVTHLDHNVDLKNSAITLNFRTWQLDVTYKTLEQRRQLVSALANYTPPAYSEGEDTWYFRSGVDFISVFIGPNF